MSRKGHRPGVRQALGANLIPPLDLGFLTFKMGVILLPHGSAIRVGEDWKSQEGGCSKGKVVLGEACLF